MKHATDRDVHPAQCAPRTSFGESAHSDDHPWLEMLDRSPQRLVANGFESQAFLREKFIRRSIATRSFEEHEWTVVRHEELIEKPLRRAERVPRPSPQPRPADLTARAGEPLHRPGGMFAARPVDRNVDPQPVADQADLAEGHAGLSHPPRSGVHTQQDDLAAFLSVSSDICGVAGPGVIQWVVDVFHRRSKTHRPQRMRQIVRNGEKSHPKKLPANRIDGQRRHSL